MMDIFSNKEYIKQMQKYLYYLSLTDPQIPRISADGIYGAETVKAVSAYQSKRAMPVTGMADEVTWYSIKSDYDAMMEKCASPAPLRVFAGHGDSVGIGEKSDTVYLIQVVLRCLDTEYGFGDPIRMTGEFSSKDATAVKKLQTVHGLQETGTVDIETWNCMASDYALFLSENE